ncbi:MAG: hypothetical protein H0T08_07265, partial [Acidobacteria bacterium]|nr:hypothetical protein [Acidobacteriota bacterium]
MALGGLIFLINIAAVIDKTSAQTTQSAAPPNKTSKVDRSRLEVIEELSESLANDLLELSVAARDRDLSLTAEFFPVQLTAKPFPSSPSATKTQIKWVDAHNWETPGGKIINASGNPASAGKITSKAFLVDWSEFLEHFSEIEDARFKVKEA